MLIGYARVSTQDQQLDLQLDALSKAGCEKIYTDKVSGAKEDRPGLSKALEYCREGDTLVVWRLDRLGRSLKHLIELVNDIQDRGIGFISLTESIDTTTPGGRLIFHVFGALSQFERELIKERVNAGLKAARARGKVGGRPKKLNTKQQQLIVSLYNDKKHSIADICSMLDVSKPTLYKYVNA